MIRLAPVVLILMSVLGMSGLAASSTSVQGGDDETLAWLDDYHEAMALAKQTGRPVFVELRCAP